MIFMGNKIDDLRFIEVARLLDGTFKADPEKLITTFENHGRATLVRLLQSDIGQGPMFIYPDGNSFRVDALILREGGDNSFTSATMVSLEVYDKGADQRLTKITLTKGDPEITTEEVNPSNPEILSEEDQRVLREIIASRPSSR